MILSNVAIQNQNPIWMNMQGKAVSSEHDGYGMKVTTTITRPDVCLILDKCGCNLSQERDSMVGGELHLTGINQKAYESRSTKHNHFTIIEVTLLNRHLLMCVIIITGKTYDVLVELGVDVYKLKDIDVDAMDEMTLSEIIHIYNSLINSS